MCSQCSHHDCCLACQSVSSFILKYEKKLDDDAEFPCYHSPRDTSKLVESIKFTSTDVIHSMLWPSIAFILGLGCVAWILYHPLHPCGKCEKLERWRNERLRNTDGVAAASAHGARLKLPWSRAERARQKPREAEEPLDRASKPAQNLDAISPNDASVPVTSFADISYTTEV